MYQTGEPFIAHSYPIDLQRTTGQPLERRYLDFVYQAMREAGWHEFPASLCSALT